MNWLKPFLSSERLATFLLVCFVVLMLPGLFPASGDRFEILTFSWDEMFFMLPPFRDIARGQYPSFYTYGNVPAFAAALIFWPVLLITGQTSLTNSAFHLVVMCRITQLVVATLGLYTLYRLSLRFCSSIGALIILALAMSSPALCIWTFTLHPDVYQATLFYGAVFFLVRYVVQANEESWVRSAALCGLSVGCKYWGIFLFPAAACAAWSSSPHGGGWWKSLVRYIAVALGAFLVFNMRFITDTRALYDLFLFYKQQNKPVEAHVLNPDLWRMKLSLLTSPQFYGSLFMLAYGMVLAVRVREAIRQPDRRHFQPLDVLHTCFLSMLAYFLIFFNDVANLPDGERYLLPFMPLLLIPVVSALESAASRQRLRLVAIAVGLVLAISQVARVTGLPSLTLNIGQGDLWGQKPVSGTVHTLRRFYAREEQGRFLIREWIIQNVEKSASIYGEAYMNISSDMPLKKMDCDFEIRVDRLKALKPDYVFTKDQGKVAALEAGGLYRSLGSIGNVSEGRVYILRRTKKS